MDAILSLERSSAGTAERCSWEIPRLKTTIQISLEVVDRIERDALAAFRAVTQKGSEIGGLLLGRQIEESAGVLISDVVLISCDYSRGPLYRLSDADEERLRAALAERRDGLSVVGFFRSHTRKEIALDESDMALFERYFPSPAALALLVKPFSMKPSRAAFFLRTGEEMTPKQAFEFSFRRGDLEKGAGPVLPSGGMRPPRPAPVAVEPKVIAALEALHKSVGSAVPVAPVEAPAPVPVASAQVVEAEAVRVEAPPAPVIVPDPEPEPEPEPVVVPDPVVEVKPAETEAVADVEAAAVPVSPAPVYQVAVAPASKSRRKLWPWIVAVAAAGLGVGVYLKPAEVGSILPSRDDGALSLRVERFAGQIRLSWDRTAPAVQRAQKATLTILDGKERQDLEMDITQLRTGTLVYAPNTSDVTFRLEVSDLTRGKTWTESVRDITSRPSPLGPPAQEPAPAVATPEPTPPPVPEAKPEAKAEEPAAPAEAPTTE